MALIAKAAVQRDQADAVVRLLEHFSGLPDALSDEPPMGWTTHANFERSGEMASREPAAPCHLPHRRHHAKVAAQQHHGQLHLPRSQPRAGWSQLCAVARHGTPREKAPMRLTFRI